MHPQITDIVVGMLSWMLGGYFAGMTIGFTAFHPDLDVWALLGAVLSIAGLLLGILPAFRRRAVPVLTGVVGYYAGMLVGLLLFGDVMHDGMIETLRNPGSAVITFAGTMIGLIAGIRLDFAKFRLPLFASVIGGFFTPLLIISISNTDRIAGLPLLVIGNAAVWGGAVLWLQRQSARR